jgi:hypothetical protein
MPDDTTAALQALIAQVTTLTQTVTAQQKRLDDLHAFNSKILDEKKDVTREKDTALSSVDKLLAQLEADQRERALKAANFTRDATGKLILGGAQSEPGVYLSRDDARDPVKYREAKQQAEKRGVPLRVIEASEDPTRRNTGKREVAPTKVVTFDDEHERVRYVRADMQTGNGLVQRRLAAEREGYTIKTFHTPDDLPGHARTKFDLMERAANAGGEA